MAYKTETDKKVLKQAIPTMQMFIKTTDLQTMDWQLPSKAKELL